MLVEAIERYVCLTTNKPTCDRFFPFQHFLERPEPMQLSSQFAPKGFDVIGRFLPEFFIGLQRPDLCSLGKSGRRRKHPRLVHYCVDLAAGIVRHRCTTWGIAGKKK